ncbi:MAG: ankyrin repeat domain-containing protein, partial [Pyrinomonadaceae bacterium]
MSKKTVLDSLRVADPCTEDWDRMTGNAKVRFCSHCSKNVNNISEMTPKEAIRMARRSNGNICIRYKYDPVTKTPIFGNRLHQIARSPLAASGVMAASLALSTVTFAQGDSKADGLKTVVANERVVGESSDKNKEADRVDAVGSISGTIVDSNGAVIPNVNLRLFNEKGETIRTAMSDEEGVYMFKDIPVGAYSIKVDRIAGFGEAEAANVYVTDGRDTLAAIPLSPESVVGVEVGGVMVSVVEYRGTLAAAVASEDIEQVKNLIAHGSDVNAREEDKTTPLFIAVETGNIEIAETLLNFGAKVNSRNSEKRTPLMSIDDDASVELIDLLIRHGAKINLADKEGNTALTLAADGGLKSEIVKALINAGAEINVKNGE